VSCFKRKDLARLFKVYDDVIISTAFFIDNNGIVMKNEKLYFFRFFLKYFFP
jgi:hypothetical protein